MKILNVFSVSLVILFACSSQQAAAAIPISPGSNGQNDPSVAEFHLVANKDVTIRVSSKGLVCEFSCRAYGSHQEMWTLRINNELDAPASGSERTATCTAKSEHHDGDGHKNGMRGFHLKIYPESGVTELEVVTAEAWNDGVNLLRGDEFEVFDTVLRSTPSWGRQVSSAKMVVTSLGR